MQHQMKAHYQTLVIMGIVNFIEITIQIDMP